MSNRRTTKNLQTDSPGNGGEALLEEAPKSGKPTKIGMLQKTFNTYSLEPEVKIIIEKDTYDRLIAALTSDPVLQAFLPIKERDERTNVYYDTQKKFHLFSKGAECRGRLKKPAIPPATGVAGKMATYKYDLKTPFSLTNPQIGPDENDLMIRGERSHTETFHRPHLQWFTKPEEQHLAPEALASAKAEAKEVTEYLGEDKLDKKLVPWAGGTFQRHITSMGVEDSVIEVAIEKGRFHNIERTQESEEFFVIELESKGDEVNLNHLVQAIGRLKTMIKQTLGVDLETSGKTKGEMAFEWLNEAGLVPEELQDNFDAALAAREKLYTPARHALSQSPS